MRLPSFRLVSLFLSFAVLPAFARSVPPASDERIQVFGPEGVPLSTSGVTREEGGWKIVRKAAERVPLFEVAVPALDDCKVVYRAKLRSQGLSGKAYLEMWVRVAGVGEAFSRGLDQPLTGDTGWVTREIPFFLQKGEKADLVKLGLVFEGAGTVWIRDIELLKAPLPK
jgi:hypothetical protein